MAHSTYLLRKLFGPVWLWEATYRTQSATGYGLGKRAAQRAARAWLRATRADDVKRRTQVQN